MKGKEDKLYVTAATETHNNRSLIEESLIKTRDNDADYITVGNKATNLVTAATLSDRMFTTAGITTDVQKMVSAITSTGTNTLYDHNFTNINTCVITPGISAANIYIIHNIKVLKKRTTQNTDFSLEHLPMILILQ